MKREGALTDYSLEEIVKNGLCMGCGLCRSALPEAVTATQAQDGLDRPREKRPLTRADRQKLNRLCPGVRVSYPPTDITPDPMWGPVRWIGRGFSADAQIRHRAASGGSLTTFALHLLESGEAESILHVRADPDRPLLSRVSRSRTGEEVIAASGSRYSATAPLVNIMEVLDEGRPFVFIGKPCDVTGLANLARLDPRVDDLCKYRLAMVCGGFSGLSRFREQLSLWDVAEKDLVEFRFRGEGCPGPTAAATRDGRRRQVPYWEFWGGQEESFRIFFRCKICPDGIGLSADIAVLDVWDNANPTEEDDGWNAVICRTARGKELVEAVEAQGSFVFDRVWKLDDLSRVQPHQTQKRRALKARFEAMRQRGVPYPRSEDPGLDMVSFDETSAEFREEREGTLERLERGSHQRAD